jgi:hypothetical protein
MQDIQKMVSHLAPRQERRTSDRTMLPAPQQSAQPAARSPQPAKQKPRVTERWCGAQNTGMSASARTETESAAWAANVRGEARDFRTFASGSANQDDPSIIDELA